MYFKLIILLFLFYCTSVLAQENKLTLQLHDTRLSEAIHLITRFLQMNVVQSSAIQGNVTLSLQAAEPEKALDLLLLTHNLARLQEGNIWLIGPRDELFKKKQEEAKWQEQLEVTTPLTTVLWQMKYAKAQDIAHLLQDEHASFLSRHGQVRVDTRTNMLLIKDNPKRLAEVKQLITRLDVPVAQIAIAARLANVDSDYERELGIQLSALSSAMQEQSERTRGVYSLTKATLADNSLLDVRLKALEAAGRAELISSPSLLMANQQSAAIAAGEEVPYQENSSSGATATVFKKAVLSLKVTPQILPNRQILLKLHLTQDKPGSRIVLGVPTISTREVATSILAKDGETIVLGGIYEINQEQDSESLPFLGQLPIINWLVGTSHAKTHKRELLIFITPKIIRQTA